MFAQPIAPAQHSLARTATDPVAVIVTDMPTLLCAANDARKIAYLNIGGVASRVYVGFTDDVDPTNGILLLGGDILIEDRYSGAIYAVTESGTATVRVQEAYE